MHFAIGDFSRSLNLFFDFSCISFVLCVFGLSIRWEEERAWHFFWSVLMICMRMHTFLQKVSSIVNYFDKQDGKMLFENKRSSFSDTRYSIIKMQIQGLTALCQFFITTTFQWELTTFEPFISNGIFPYLFKISVQQQLNCGKPRLSLKM